MFNRAPDPNATKVFVNWLLTREVQTRISQSVRRNSRRLDVPAVDPETRPDPARLDEYVDGNAEDFLPVRERLLRLTNELLR